MPLGRLTILGLLAGVGGVLLIATMLATNPVTIGPAGVTVWFIILFITFASVLTLLLYGVKTYFHVHDTHKQRLRYSLRQGLLLAGWTCGLLALSSLGQVGWRDGILLGLAAIIVEVYVRLRLP